MISIIKVFYGYGGLHGFVCVLSVLNSFMFELVIGVMCLTCIYVVLRIVKH